MGALEDGTEEEADAARLAAPAMRNSWGGGGIVVASGLQADHWK